MDDGIIVLIAFLTVVAGLGGYTIKRNFDENQSYIAHGYHQTPAVGQTWVKE